MDLEPTFEEHITTLQRNNTNFNLRDIKEMITRGINRDHRQIRILEEQLRIAEEKQAYKIRFRGYLRKKMKEK